MLGWFPGHMNKARRQIKDALPEIDVVIEVLDARLPYSSANPMLAELTRLSPAELLVPESLSLPDAWSQKRSLRRQGEWLFDLESATRSLCDQFEVSDLRGFGCAHLSTALVAAGVLIDYARDTQRSRLPHVTSISVENRDDAVVIDAASRRNLEIDINLGGNGDNTLASVLDTCATAMGSRLLKRWLNRPLRQREIVEGRQAGVALLSIDAAYMSLRETLSDVGDVERILARVALYSARPRDLARLRDALATLPTLEALLADIDTGSALDGLTPNIRPYPTLADTLNRALVDNPPVVIRDGGVIADGFDAELDEHRGMAENAGDYLVQLELREREHEVDLSLTRRRVRIEHTHVTGLHHDAALREVEHGLHRLEHRAPQPVDL